MGNPVDVLIHAYRVLGFEQDVSGDAVFGQLVLALPRFREGIVAAAPRRGLRRARLETLVPPGSRPARRVLTDHERVPGAGRAVQGIAPVVNRGQNVAIGLTGLPDVPAKRTGATARWKSHWPSSAAVVEHTSRSQLSSSHRPIATRLTA